MFALVTQVLWCGRPNDLFIKRIISNALSTAKDDGIQTKTFPSLRPTLDFPHLRPTPAFLPGRPIPAFLPNRPTLGLHSDRTKTGFRAYSRADAVAAVEESLLAAPAEGGAALDLTMSLGQLLFTQKLPDVVSSTTSSLSESAAVTAAAVQEKNLTATSIDGPMHSGGLIHQADLEAAGVQPYFITFLLATPKPAILRRLGDQGYQVATSGGADHLDSYTQVNFRAEPEQLSASVSLAAVDDDLPRLLHEDEDTDGLHGMGKPVKMLSVKTER